MSSSPSVPPPCCKVPGCGRKMRAGGLCQTHYKQLRKTGTVRPIVRQRPARPKVVRLAGLTVTPICQEQVTRHASERGVALNAVVTDILESWAKRYWARNRPPRKPRR